MKILFRIPTIILLLFLSQLSALAQTNPLRQEFQFDESPYIGNRNYHADVIFTLMGRRFDDTFVQSRYGRAIVEASLGVKYENWLEGKLALAQVMTSGAASHQMSVTEAGIGSGTYLDEATVSVKPTDWVTGKAGVLYVEFSPIYSLHYPQSQAGGALVFSNTWGSNDSDIQFTASLEGSQSIPTARSSGNIITDENTSPLLTLGSFHCKFVNKYTGTTVRLSAAHFEYTDLSTASAADSLKIGSSVMGQSDLQFIYEFRGKELAAALKQEFGLSHAVEVKGSMLRNERAPASLNQGHQVKVEYTRSFDKWELKPSVTQFYVESDSLPAVFAQSGFGYTNREGYAINVKANFPKEKFNIFGGYTNAQAIHEAGVIRYNSNMSTYQMDREIYTLGAEVAYEIF